MACKYYANNGKPSNLFDSLYEHYKGVNKSEKASEVAAATSWLATNTENFYRFFGNWKEVKVPDAVTELSRQSAPLQHEEPIQPLTPQQVEKLFDENPDIANQVYEELGFNKTSKPNIEERNRILEENSYRIPIKEEYFEGTNQNTGEKERFKLVTYKDNHTSLFAVDENNKNLGKIADYNEGVPVSKIFEFVDDAKLINSIHQGVGRNMQEKILSKYESKTNITPSQKQQAIEYYIEKQKKRLSDISSIGKLSGDFVQSEKGQIGVNKQQLLMLLGPTMYNKPLAQVAVKELLQNSFDAIKARINLLKDIKVGNIDIAVNYDNRTISIKDDGIGMTPDIVKNAFLSIGGTNKEGLDVSERSGGFGLAKVQFLLGSEYVKVVTVKDGIKTSLEASATQLYNDDFEIFTENTNEPNGSFVEVKIPESYTTPEGTVRNIDFPGAFSSRPYERFDILDKPLIGDTNVNFKWVKQGNTNNKTLPLGKNIDENALPPLFSKIEFNWGTADLYMSIDKKENPKHRILSSGIFQFTHRFSFKDWEDIPYDIVINIKPNVSSTSEQYPFNNQREGFKNTVKEDIKSLNDYLKKYASGEAEKDAKAVFSNITGLPKSDPNKVLTPEEREKLYTDVQKTIEENKQRRIDLGLEDVEQEARRIYKLIIDSRGVTNEETGEIEVSNEKNYGSSFKSDRQIEKVESIDTVNFNPALPQYHNNTNFDYLSIEGAAEFFSDYGSVVLEMVRFAGNELGHSYEKLKSENEKFFAGVSIDKTYAGVHVRKVINAIFINPLAFKPASLEEAVGIAIATTVHELNHTTVSGEGDRFTTAEVLLYGKIYGTGKFSLYEGLFRSVFKKHFETFKKLKHEYDKSSTRNLSESFQGDEVKGDFIGPIQRDVNDVSARQSSEEGYSGTQENNTEDRTGDVILSNLNNISTSLTPTQKENISNLKQEDARWQKYSDEDIQRFIDSVFNKFVIDNINENLYQKVVSSLINQKIIERQC